MIKSGEKKEEYREIKHYYDVRFAKYVGYSVNVGFYVPLSEPIIFRNGYSKSSPSIKCRCEIAYDYGKAKWGAKPNEIYYVLRILSVEEINNG